VDFKIKMTKIKKILLFAGQKIHAFRTSRQLIVVKPAELQCERNELIVFQEELNDTNLQSLDVLQVAQRIRNVTR
jgi:hypothetical protein